MVERNGPLDLWCQVCRTTTEVAAEWSVTLTGKAMVTGTLRAVRHQGGGPVRQVPRGPAGDRIGRPGGGLIFDGVVPGHLAQVLEAEDPFQMQEGVQGAIGGLVLLGRDTELGVASEQEVPQHGDGLVDGGSSRQPEFADQPVLECAGHAFRASLGLWPMGKDLLDAHFPPRLG